MSTLEQLQLLAKARQCYADAIDVQCLPDSAAHVYACALTDLVAAATGMSAPDDWAVMHRTITDTDRR